MSIASHAQTDGQTERMNQWRPTSTASSFPVPQSGVSGYLSRSSGTTPRTKRNQNGTLCGLVWTITLLPGNHGCFSASSDRLLWLAMRTMPRHRILRQHLHRANNRMKQFADRKRAECSFVVGDWVYLRLQPYI
jgi:hypothetical protein